MTAKAGSVAIGDEHQRNGEGLTEHWANKECDSMITTDIRQSVNDDMNRYVNEQARNL